MSVAHRAVLRTTRCVRSQHPMIYGDYPKKHFIHRKGVRQRKPLYGRYMALSRGPHTHDRDWSYVAEQI